MSPLVTPFRHILLGRGGHTLPALAAQLGGGDGQGMRGDAGHLRLRLALLAWTLQGTAGALAGDAWDRGDIWGRGDLGDRGDVWDHGSLEDGGDRGDIWDHGGLGDGGDSGSLGDQGDVWDHGGLGDSGDGGDTRDYEENGDSRDRGDPQGPLGTLGTP